MSKLFTLREWLSLEQTAKHLTTVFNEEVSVTDVLALALEKRLILSLRFEFRVLVREVIPTDLPADAKWGADYINTLDNRIFKLSNEVTYADEVFDLPMIGGEKECVRMFEWHNDIDYEWALPFEEFFLSSESGKTYVTIQRKEVAENENDYMHISNFNLDYGMPKGSRLVVKTKSIRSIIESLQQNPPKDLSKNGEKAYLNIIGAMLELLKTPRQGRDSDAAVIRELVDNYGDKHGISKSNLDRKLPEAKRSLAAD